MFTFLLLYNFVSFFIGFCGAHPPVISQKMGNFCMFSFTLRFFFFNSELILSLALVSWNFIIMWLKVFNARKSFSLLFDNFLFFFLLSLSWQLLSSHCCAQAPSCLREWIFSHLPETGWIGTLRAVARLSGTLLAANGTFQPIWLLVPPMHSWNSVCF